MTDRDALVETITREVLAAIAGEAWDECLSCVGDCVVHSAHEGSLGARRRSNPRHLQRSGRRCPDRSRRVHRPHAAQTRCRRLRHRPDVRRGAGIRVCLGVRQPHVGEASCRRAEGSGVVACCVVGFPFGAATAEIKAMEARRAIRDGARDRYGDQRRGAQVGGFRSGAARHCRGLEACREAGALCKVILETALLSDEEKVIASVAGGRGEGRLRQDVDRLRPWGSDGLRRSLDARGGRSQDRREGLGGIRNAEDVKQMIAAGGDQDWCLGRDSDRDGRYFEWQVLIFGATRSSTASNRNTQRFSARLPRISAARRGLLSVRRDLARNRDQPHDRCGSEGHESEAGHADRRAVLRAARGPLPVAGRTRAAGAAILAEIGVKEEDRIKPRIASSQIIRRIDDHQAQPINRMRHGQMIIPGQTMYLLEMEPASYAAARRQ